MLRNVISYHKLGSGGGVTFFLNFQNASVLENRSVLSVTYHCDRLIYELMTLAMSCLVKLYASLGVEKDTMQHLTVKDNIQRINVILNLQNGASKKKLMISL